MDLTMILISAIVARDFETANELLQFILNEHGGAMPNEAELYSLNYMISDAWCTEYERTNELTGKITDTDTVPYVKIEGGSEVGGTVVGGTIKVVFGNHPLSTIILKREKMARDLRVAALAKDWQGMADAINNNHFADINMGDTIKLLNEVILKDKSVKLALQDGKVIVACNRLH